jgi:hypothetical protein
MKPSPGLRGIAERLIVPRANVPIYRKELRLLETVARQRSEAGVSSDLTRID